MANSPATSMLDVGSVIADTYAIEGLLGRGGMGAVFLASHARLPGKKVAIKVLHPDVADPESLARFRREAEIASRLGHPNIVDVLDWNQLPDGTPYLVLEYLDGEPLSGRLARGPIPLEQTFAIVRQIGSALAAAHAQDIVHRDLKPQNVFLVPTEADGYVHERAKVLDFGISKIRGSQTVKTQDTAILGTPQYMAPEQATGNHAAVDQRTDVFALGAMVYEMLSGKGAFAGVTIPEVVFKVVYEDPTPLGEVVPGLPANVVAAVTRAMSKKSDDRFPTVDAFVEALTGAPLATMRRGIAVAPGDGSTPSMRTAADAAALAQTVGSGDHAAQLGLGTASTMATGSGGSAATGASAAAAAGSAATMPVAAPAEATTSPTLSKPAHGKTPVMMIMVVFVAVAAAVAVMVTVKGGHGGGDTAAAPDPGSGTAVAMAGSGSDDHGMKGRGLSGGSAGSAGAPVPDHTGNGSAAVAGSGSGSGSGSAAVPTSGSGSGSGSATHDHGHTRPDHGGGQQTDDTPAALKGLLTQAEQALDAGQRGAAVHLANQVISKAPRSAEAWSIKARAACMQQDREGALTALRHMAGRRAAVRRTIRACKELGVELR
jgi:eukaryotic-like serine/threonine-protein kinase